MFVRLQGLGLKGGRGKCSVNPCNAVVSVYVLWLGCQGEQRDCASGVGSGGLGVDNYGCSEGLERFKGHGHGVGTE